MKPGKADDPRGEEGGPTAAKSREEALVSSLSGTNMCLVVVKMFFYQVVVDVVLLVVGCIYVAKVGPNEDMRPVYLAVRGAVGLATTPVSVGAQVQGTRLTKKLIALKIIGGIMGLARFGWLIYGTVLVCKVFPKDKCDDACSWTLLGSIVMDWTWIVVITSAALFPLCWDITDQCSTFLFFIYLNMKKQRQQKSGYQK